MFKTKTVKVIWLMVLLTVLASVIYLTPAYSAEIIDQSYQPDSFSSSHMVGINNNVGYSVLQTFVPSHTGSLTAVGFFTSSVRGASGLGELQADIVTVTSSGTPTRTSLGFGTIASPTPDAWGKITLESPVQVMAGTRYAIHLTCNRCINDSYYNFGFNRSAPYVNGMVWTSSTKSTGFISGGSEDLGFITYMDIVSTNNQLSGLELSDGELTPGFSSNETSYNVNVPYRISLLNVMPTVADRHATVTVNGKSVVSGKYSDTIVLDLGRNTILVEVTAENRATKTYTISLFREYPSDDARLSNLVPSTGTLSPGFSSNTTDYQMTVPYEQTKIQLTPTTFHPYATLTVNGKITQSAGASDEIELAVGDNLIQTVVTAQDLTTKRTYTVNVYRSPKPITITTPTNGALNNQALPVVSGQAYNGAIIQLSLNGAEVQEVTAQPDGSWSYTFTKAISTGVHTLTAIDKQFKLNRATVQFTTDLLGPMIQYAQTPPPSMNWNNSDVTITFTCDDAYSRVATCPEPALLTNEGANQSVTVEAKDHLGNQTTLTVSNINIDKTNPLITANAHKAANANGWYNEPVTVNFTCSDELSGISFCAPPVYVKDEGADQPVSGISIDKAGNIGTTSAPRFNLDFTAPSLSYSIEGTKNGNWYTSNVKILFTCNDRLSGIATCLEPVELTGEGLTAAKEYEVFDRAGNRASVTVEAIRIDKTAPGIQAVYPAANSKGWYNKSFEIQFTCTDAISGVDGCPSPIQVVENGKNISYSRKVADFAGNQSSVTVSGLNVDTVAPSTPVLQSTAVTNQSVSLKWSAAIDPFAISPYEIFRDGIKVASTEQLTYQDQNLISGKTYNYRVVVSDEAGNATSSNSLSVTTTANHYATIYYRVPAGWNARSFYHYTPIGGQWTSAPGLLMSRSTFNGFHVIEIDMGRFTSMQGVFTSGNGLWDNNNAKNYVFPTGVSTLDNGVIKPGTPGVIDQIPPTTPLQLASSNTGNTSTHLTWSPSTDNVNVTGYTVIRNGVAIATRTSNAFTDTGLNPGTTYTYNVLAFDAAGNRSQASTAVSVTTTSVTNTLTVYYKVPATWNSTSFFHYRPNGGVWTQAPGLRMTATNFNGFNVITVDLTPFTGAQAVFNNGASMWDNNSNKDYVLEKGVYTINDGLVTVGTPQVDSVAPSTPTNVSIDQATVQSITLKWNASTDNVAVKSYQVLRNGIVVGTTTSTTFTDNGLVADTTYQYSIVAVDFSANPSPASLSVSGKTNKGNLTTIYYKVPSGNVSIIHYKPSNGVWTNVPTQMTPSPFAGFNMITIDLGSSTSLLAAFNNGAGIWDNNNKNDYFFALGTFTLHGSVITNGLPVVSPVLDTTAPTVPSGLVATNIRSTQLTLSWSPSTDNVGVNQYEVYRNGALVGTVKGTTYTDSALLANTAYVYTIRAVDGAGNKSAASSSLNVRTATSSTIKIYYKAATNGVTNIHYRPSNGTWTTAPGVRMSASEVAGYNVITLDIGTSTSITAVFNNGAGVWDNNQTRNYTFNPGVFSLTNGVIKVGTP